MTEDHANAIVRAVAAEARAREMEEQIIRDAGVYGASLATAQADVAEARERIRDLEAQAAAMREALEWLGDEGYVEYHEDPDCPMDDTCECEVAERFNAALASDAGRALLAKLEALRPRRKLYAEREADLFVLLRKLAAGTGGTRTGELARRGWLTWTVTPNGLDALAKNP